MTDAPRNPHGLAPGAADLLQRLVRRLVSGGLVEYVDLGKGRVLRIFQTGVQAGEVVVNDLGIAAGHRPREDGVDEVDHRARGTEVARQRQELSAIAAQVALIAVEKKARLGEAEAIDGLFDVADGEEVVAARNGGDERLLKVGNVLIFVDEDVVVLLADALSHLLAHQGAQCATLEIGVGKAAALLLAAGVLLSNAPRSLGEDGIDVVKLQRVFPRPLERQIIQRTALDGVAGKFAQRLDGVEGVGIDVAVAAGGLRLLETAQARGQFLRFPDLA